MEISDKVLVASGLKEDPNAEPEVADGAGDEFSDADDEPITLD